MKVLCKLVEQILKQFFYNIFTAMWWADWAELRSLSRVLFDYKNQVGMLEFCLFEDRCFLHLMNKLEYTWMLSLEVAFIVYENEEFIKIEFLLDLSTNFT